MPYVPFVFAFLGGTPLPPAPIREAIDCSNMSKSGAHTDAIVNQFQRGIVT
jgi:hypothetical protein